jgi:hypothetical protein
MITGWGVENFKSIRSSSLSISNLNVLMGANSVGKSSLIHSMIALGQLSAEQLPADTVQLIGNSQDLGSAGSVLHRYPGKRRAQSVVFRAESNSSYSLQFTYSIRLEVSPTRVNDFVVADEILETGTEAHRTIVSLKPLKGPDSPGDARSVSVSFGEVSFEDVARVSVSSRGQMPEIEVATWFDTFLRIASDHHGTLNRPVSPAKQKSNPQAKKNSVRRPTPLSFYASKIMEMKGKSRTQEDKVELERYRNANPSGELSAANSSRFLPDSPVKVDDASLDSLMRALSHEWSDSKSTTFNPPGLHILAIRALKILERGSALGKLGASFMHLGPLRVVAPSQQQNRRSPSEITPLGVSGEFLAHTLSVKGTETAEYPLPDGNARSCTLVDALNSWTAFLGLDGTIRTEFVEGLTTRITLGNRMFSQLGSGVSQVVPVIAICLLAASRKESLAIIEQPELHLHPNLQRKMADMFAIMASNGARMLIETHSEYLVTRLRLLLAKKQLDPKHVSLIFAEQRGSSRNGKHAEIRQASVTETGDSDYWPAGFHSESLRDRFELSALQMMELDGE